MNQRSDSPAFLVKQSTDAFSCKSVCLEIIYRRFNDDFRVRVNKMRSYSIWFSKLI